MSCGRIRDRLVAGADPATFASHLEECPACASFAERAVATRQALADHHAGVRPAPGFAGRVAANVPTGSTEFLGRAALQLLPAALVLLVVLSWFAMTSRNDMPLPPAPTDNVLTWVVDGEGTP